MVILRAARRAASSLRGTLGGGDDPSVHKVGPGMVGAGDRTDVTGAGDVGERAIGVAGGDRVGGSRSAYAVADDEAAGGARVDGNAVTGDADDLVPVDKRLPPGRQHRDARRPVGDVV